MNGIPHYMPCNAARIGKTDLIAHCKGWNGRHNPLVRRELEVFATKRMTLAGGEVGERHLECAPTFASM